MPNVIPDDNKSHLSISFNEDKSIIRIDSNHFHKYTCENSIMTDYIEIKNIVSVSESWNACDKDDKVLEISTILKNDKMIKNIYHKIHGTKEEIRESIRLINEEIGKIKKF